MPNLHGIAPFKLYSHFYYETTGPNQPTHDSDGSWVGLRQPLLKIEIS